MRSVFLAAMAVLAVGTMAREAGEVKADAVPAHP